MRTHLCFYIFFIPFCLFLLDVSGQCRHDQQSVLIQLKDSLQFGSAIRNKLASWNTNVTTDCCTWRGVSCSSSGQVIGLDLSNETIVGGIDNSSVLFNLTNLQSLNLAANNFNFTQIPSRFGGFASLSYLNLSNSGFSGQIPVELSQLTGLEVLDLSSLFSYKIHSLKLENPSLATLVHNLTRLRGLYMDNVNMSSHKLDWGQGLSSSLPNLEVLSLSNCNLLGPLDESLQKLQSLSVLRLNLNDLNAPVPDFLANFKNLTILNLAACNLIGTFPKNVLKLQKLQSLDYSNNLLNLSLSEISWRDFNSLFFFSASNNSLTGTIPKTICNAASLKVVDLSNNRLTGRIPQCLIEFGNHLEVLNLANNGLTGQIEGTFPTTCRLNTLDLHGNSLEGKIPRSIVNCRMLQVLNIGNNWINDTYPCSLGNFTNLRVLVLRNNSFHGSTHCNEGRHNWSNLRILDIAHNNFNGVVPPEFFSQCGAMMTVDNRASTTQLSYMAIQGSYYYQDAVTVTVKGFELELVKILTIFTTIDISSNHFAGVIPETIGQLKALHFLNISHNEFTGSIPTSIGALSQLESLDMSSNKITGEIPSVLTSLSFLSALNLSYNQLEGTIPTGTQFQTFSETSYLGNKRLCGVPLNLCSSITDFVPSSPQSSDASSAGNDCQTFFYGMGAGAGSLTVAVVLYTL